MRLGIDVMQPHPGPEPAQIARQIGDMGAVTAGLGVANIGAVGRSVLADHQQFAHPGPRIDGMMQNLQ